MRNVDLPHVFLTIFAWSDFEQKDEGDIVSRESYSTCHRGTEEHLGGVQPLYRNFPWTQIFARICRISEFCFGGLFFISSATLQRRAAFESGEGWSLRTCKLWQAGAH